jgi:hypothetical protein
MRSVECRDSRVVSDILKDLRSIGSTVLYPLLQLEMLRSKMSVKSICQDRLTISISRMEINSLVRREMFTPSLVTFSSSSSLKADFTYIPVMSGADPIA